ncbi:ABC transporter ATP-binding protein [Candidatus Gottesmanbacteria bacterium RIFCSPHIGHO2_02_FULL_39_14]|uniref:ABC transporter ATP-binding protein n=1 Tax=Candidatus Gottesmanbacteria bacterium RIFCSPHIGHO2_02_FULL_39_14 TaxID=1798383 RepID=A0A1F6A0Z7_9BACT|nr:MAG: ABC transporter ATP-binding protein [Candidatus Gottesmanbacteria bacterium RIFCSPHIGHO2_02_FULL_39_14]
MIELINISKIYQLDGGNFTALDKINLRIKEGELIAITGPSGCGKSTLMHIIGLLDTPTIGKVIINGRNIQDLTDNEISALRNVYAGFVFQQFNLINKLNVLENILLPTQYSRQKKTFIAKDRALDLMDRFGIKEKAQSYPNKLSGGQQQRVAITRALINKPKIILADEPTGNLDSKTGTKILDILIELNKKDNLTILIVTHDKEIALRFPRIIQMFDGKIVKA